jgi:DNA-binding MarR family transcriptional regulator
MTNRWLTAPERAAWVRLMAVTELLPGALDAQLRRDSALTHFEYFVLAMLSEAPERTLPMTALARLTSASLPRLSHVVRRLEERGLLSRRPSPDDGRVTIAALTEQGHDVVVAAAPGHVDLARRLVIDALTPAQLEQLSAIADALLPRLDPDGRLTSLYDPA